MRTAGKYLLPLTALILVMALPGAAEAQQVSGVFGRLLGDDVLDQAPFVGSVQGVEFADANLYGARVSWGLAGPELELSVVYSPSKLLENTRLEVDADFLYGEANVLLGLLPGPVEPFVTGGIGLHRISLDIPGTDAETKLGYNVGAGVKVGLGGLGVRADLRDHITPLDFADIDPQFAEALDLLEGNTLHNVELSFGLMFSF